MDHTFAEGDSVSFGSLVAHVVHLPGHTPDHIGYVIGANVFTGDSVFNPDLGTARCDFPGGSAEALYASASKLSGFPAHFRLYTRHDYPPKDRDGAAWETVKRCGADAAEAAKPGLPVPYTTVEAQKAGE